MSVIFNDQNKNNQLQREKDLAHPLGSGILWYINYPFQNKKCQERFSSHFQGTFISTRIAFLPEYLTKQKVLLIVTMLSMLF